MVVKALWMSGESRRDEAVRWLRASREVRCGVMVNKKVEVVPITGGTRD